MREISVLKERILQYIDYKNISKYEFYKITGMSNGILSQSNGFSEENTLKLLSYFPEINPEWLLTGKGSMLREQPQKDPINLVSEPQASYSTNTSQSLERELDLLKTQLKDKERIISMLEKEVIRLENELKKFTS